MNNYIIKGGNGWKQTLWCHPTEAIRQWQKIGGSPKLYVVNSNGDEVLIRGEDPTPPQPIKKVDPPVALDVDPESFDPVRRPIRTWYATPSY